MSTELATHLQYEDDNIKFYKWSHNFGKKLMDYNRLEYNEIIYLYDYKTKEYIGAYDEKANTINKSIPDPTE
jgi:hypothetical protein